MKLQDITDNILMNTHKIGDILQYNDVSKILFGHPRYLYRLIEKNIEKREMTFQILHKDKQPTLRCDEVFKFTEEPSVSLRKFSRHES